MDMVTIRNTKDGRTVDRPRHLAKNLMDLTRFDNRGNPLWELVGSDAQEEPKALKKSEEVAATEKVEEIPSETEPQEFAPVDEADVTDVDEIGVLRDAYFKKFGKNPDKRWKENRLREELNKPVEDEQEDN